MSISPSEPSKVSAQYFDGLSAKAHLVTLTLIDGVLSARGETIQRDEAITSLRVSEPMGAAPRLISYPGGAHCEVRDHLGMNALLAAGNYEDSLVVRLQYRWRWAVASVVLAVATAFAGYYWGLPAASEWVAYKVPDTILAKLGSSTMGVLDRAIFKPTELPEARRAALSSAFDRLVVSGVRPHYNLQFRNGGGAGANAMALPDGAMVVTDQLIALAAHDEEILAVLTHELGHISCRHGLRMLIQGSIVAFVVSWYLGDISSVAAGLPTLVLQARYSRNHESEADEFAAAMLKANGMSPRRLADMLAKLEASHRMRLDKQKKQAGESDQPSANRSAISDYLASHPATRERIDALNGAR
jgi:Zn-dependent protease with chaperone function